MQGKTIMVLAMVVLVVGVVGADTRDSTGAGCALDSFLLNVAQDDLTLNFSCWRGSTSEWGDKVTFAFPAAWSIISMTTTNAGPSGPGYAGVGTNTAVFGSTFNCSGFGWIDETSSSPAILVVHVNPNGVLGTQTIPYMYEGDNYSGGGGSPHVVCSATHSCGFNACYGGAPGVMDPRPADLVADSLPVTLQTFSVE